MNATVTPPQDDGSAATGFFAALVRRPITLLVVFVTLMVIGVIAYVRIPLQMMPEGIVEPGLQVFAMHPGASAEENEERVARLLEEELRTIAGIAELSSRSSDDSVNLSVRFDAEVDMDLAKAEVRDRIERARPKLPTTVREIGIWSWSESNMPVMFFAMLHPGDSQRTDFLIDTVIQRRLDSVDGIGRMELWGVLDDSVRIELDEQRVRAAGLDLGALIGRLSADNFALPMGEVTDGGRRVLLRSDMRFRDKATIEQYPIGSGLVIADVARVIDAKSVRNRLFRMDGTYAYFGEVQRESQANVVEVCKRLDVALKELEADPRLEGKFKFLVFFDQGQIIEGSVAQLRDSAITGGLLSILILFLFIPRVRMVMCMALAIPVSVLLAVAWVYFSGGTFNILTMAGITLAMGMLVDNAVVVVENISRVRALGLGNLAAAAQGTREVALAVLLSTLTTVVVFMPMIFMSENPTLRIMFGALGLPLCVSLLASLLAALIFLPVVTARVIGPRHVAVEFVALRIARVADYPGKVLAVLVGAVRALTHGAMRMLSWAVAGTVRLIAWLRWPLAAAIVAMAIWRGTRIAATLDAQAEYARVAGAPTATGSLVALGVVTLLAVSIVLFGSKRWRDRQVGALARPASLVPKIDGVVDGCVKLNRALLEWTLAHRLGATLATLAALASVAVPMTQMKVAAFGEDENTSRVRVEVDLEDNFTLEQAEQEMAHYERFFQDRKQRWGFQHMGCRFDKDGGRIDAYWDGRRTREQRDLVLKDMRENLHALPGHELRIGGDDGAQDRNRNVVSFRLVGPDSEELNRLGAQAVALLEGVEGLSDVRSPLTEAPEQVRVVFDSDLAHQMGISPQDALQNVSWALRGWQLPRFQEPGREVPLIIELDEERVAGLSTLRDLEIRGGESAIPLSSFSTLEYGRGSHSIERVNGKTAFQIFARVDDPLRQRELSELGRALIATIDFPRGYGLDEEDLVSERQDSEMREIYAALLLSVVLVFLLMGVLFESFLLPISVLFTIPFAIVGAMWTMFVTRTAMDSVAWIGMIILVGVVVNNGIVLIDRIHQLRHSGVERTRAILDGCGNRVRPVLMTALTTVVGLIPMASTEPPGDGIDYRALATCVAGGLSVSTLFTLWVVPLAYSVLDDLREVFAERVVRAAARVRPLSARRARELTARS